MALMQITIIPLGTSGPSVGNYIAEVEKVLRERGIEHTLGDMGTVIHGDLNALFEIARDLHELPFKYEISRVVTHITIDDRRDITRGLGDKKNAVLNRLHEENNL